MRGLILIAQESLVCMHAQCTCTSTHELVHVQILGKISSITFILLSSTSCPTAVTMCTFVDQYCLSQSHPRHQCWKVHASLFDFFPFAHICDSNYKYQLSACMQFVQVVGLHQTVP